MKVIKRINSAAMRGAQQEAVAAHASQLRRSIAMLEIPQDVIDEVVAALNRAIGLAMVKGPELVESFSQTAMRFDEAIQDATATEA